ncbi:MAG: hypothetical protein MJ117_05155 [Lachnospiraceae bacterium]|nr:hypothetical protein [Lachnospiraceae bacterium]
MLRLWGRMFRDNRLLKDITIDNTEEDTRTHRIFHALDDICYAWDLGKPIWLDSNIREFKKHNKTRFYADSFIEEIDFDYLEISILEEY